MRKAYLPCGPGELKSKSMIMDNYQGVVVKTAVSKLFECRILPSLTENFKQSTLQFGFTKI